MKNKLWIALLSTTILAACGNDGEGDGGEIDQEEPSDLEPSDSEPEDPDEEQENGDATDPVEGETSEVSQNVADYFPLEEDRLMSYASDDGEATAQWYPQFIEDNQVQYHIQGLNTQTTTVFNVSEEQVEETFRREDTSFRDNFIETGIQGDGEEGLAILLQAPIEVGHSWENPNGETSEITAVDAVISTEFGEEYEAIEVVRTNEAGEEITQYFAKGVGLVQTGGEDGVTLTLTSIEEGVPEPDHVLPVFSYQIADGDQIEEDLLIRHEVEVDLYTNDPIRLAMMDVLSQEYDFVGGRPTMDEGEINFMYMTDEGIPHVDFTDPITQDYVGGSSSEHLHNALLIDMVADYYGINEIIFTVEEEEWFGSHLQFEDIRVEAWQFEYMSEQEFIDTFGEDYTYPE